MFGGGDTDDGTKRTGGVESTISDDKDRPRDEKGKSKSNTVGDNGGEITSCSCRRGCWLGPASFSSSLEYDISVGSRYFAFSSGRSCRTSTYILFEDLRTGR